MTDRTPLEDGPVLVVGLGNPGEKYRWNRHNIGFLFLEYLAGELHSEGWRGRTKFGGELMDGRLAGRRLYLFKPLSYMNLSGGPTARIAGFFGISPSRVVVCFDDVALRFGSLRIRARGSAGGQKGMQDVIRSLGTDTLPRLRFGVGGEPGQERRPLADYVLGDLSRAARRELPELFDHARGALETLFARGVTAAAARYNRTVKDEKEEVAT